jgi:hypothetical protein
MVVLMGFDLKDRLDNLVVSSSLVGFDPTLDRAIKLFGQAWWGLA